jgi:hypothetical protein
MEQLELLSLILDSWNEEVVFIDTNHIIQYVNGPGVKNTPNGAISSVKVSFFAITRIRVK